MPRAPTMAAQVRVTMRARSVEAVMSGRQETMKLGYVKVYFVLRSKYNANLTDIDECSIGTPCADQPHTRCLNFPGGHSCECVDGFKRNDDKCESDIIGLFCFLSLAHSLGCLVVGG